MSVFTRPLALTDDGKKHEPVAPGRLLEPDLLPVSKAAGNVITKDSEGLLFAIKTLLSDSEKMLSVQDSKLRSNLALRLNSATNVLEMLGAGNVKIAEVKLPVVPGLPTVAEILKDFTPPAMEYGEQPRGAYMHLQFQMSDGVVKDIYYNVSDLVDVYTAGDGINITDNKVSFVPQSGKGLGVGREGAYVKPAELVKTGEKILSVVNNVFQTTLALQVDNKANKIKLLGTGNAVVSEVALPPYSGAPKVVEVVSNFTPPGLSRGTYLHMQFVRADGEVEDVYYSLEKVVDIYEAGNGIAITDHKVSVKAEAKKGISVTANGVAVAATEILHANEKILGVESNGFYTQLSAVMEDNDLVILGRNKQEVTRVRLPFGKGGKPTVVEFLTDFTPPPPHGADASPLPRSNYLHMHFDMGGDEEEDIYLDLPLLARWDRRIDGPLPEGDELAKLLSDMPLDGIVYYTEGGVRQVFLTPEEGAARFVGLTGDQGIEGLKTFDQTPEVPTAPAGDSSLKVANTQFVTNAITGKHAADNTIVRTTGNQTIGGTKTFSASPVVPTPAAGDNSTKAASTAFVTSAIATSHANDATLVRTVGNQTIGGTKTFSASPVIPTPARGDSSTKAASTAFVQDIKWNKTISGALPANPASLVADMPVGALVHYDGDEAVQYLTPAGADARYVGLTGNQTIAGTKTFSASPVVPTPSAQDSSQKVANTYYVQQWLATKVNSVDFTSTLQSLTEALNAAMAEKADDAAVVKLAGNQTVAGTKTFSASPVVPTAQAGDATQKAASTAFVTGAIAAAHASAPTLVRTAGDQTIDGVKTFLQSPVVPTPAKTDNSTKTASTAYVQSVFGDAVKTSGNQTIAGTKTFSASPVLPTPAAGDNSTKAATTAFVAAALAALDIDEKNDVKLTGNQTIAGVKTFSSSPVVPTAAVTDSSTKAASTAFVQTLCNNQLKVVVGSQPEDPSALIANMPVGTVIQFTE